MNPKPRNSTSHRRTRVRLYRRKLELTQKRLANQCKLKPGQTFPWEAIDFKTCQVLVQPLCWTTISRLEKHEKFDSLDYLMSMKVGSLLKLCWGLGIKPKDLWKGWPE